MLYQQKCLQLLKKKLLRLQAIVARTYTIFKINNKKHDNADICDNSTCCQAWISKEDRMAKWEDLKGKNIGRKFV